MAQGDYELLLANRRFLYSYVGRAFAAEPDEAFLAVVLDEHTREECALLDAGAQKSEPAALNERAQSAARGEDACAVLRGEYTRLFIGPASLPVPPWESVFVSPDSVLFTEDTLRVRQAYLAEGFRAAGYKHEPDDHVATELNFMAALSERAQEAFAQGDTARLRKTLLAQQRFLEENILVWLGDFATRLAGIASVGAFYPAFAALAAAVCKRDAEVIAELLAVL